MESASSMKTRDRGKMEMRFWSCHVSYSGLEPAYIRVGDVHGQVLELCRETGEDETGLDRVAKTQTAWASVLSEHGLGRSE